MHFKQASIKTIATLNWTVYLVFVSTLDSKPFAGRGDLFILGFPWLIYSESHLTKYLRKLERKGKKKEREGNIQAGLLKDWRWMVIVDE